LLIFVADPTKQSRQISAISNDPREPSRKQVTTKPMDLSCRIEVKARGKMRSKADLERSLNNGECDSRRQLRPEVL